MGWGGSDGGAATGGPGAGRRGPAHSTMPTAIPGTPLGCSAGPRTTASARAATRSGSAI